MTPLLKRALDQAAVWHREQRRKYPTAEVPYVSHPAGVALTLARHGFDDEVLAAGALHDVMEDCHVTHDALAKLFGPRVASLVQAVSEEDKSLSWEERKRVHLERLAHESWDAKAIATADKIDNFASILVCAHDHGDPWAMFKRGRGAQIDRFDAFARMLDALPPHPLCAEYRAGLEAVRSLPAPGFDHAPARAGDVPSSARKVD
jgi:(p)ppGpp synthase/HD superfamily hydrolase